MEKTFKMDYSIISKPIELEGMTLLTYGVELTKTMDDGISETVTIHDITLSKNEIVTFLKIIERGFVTPMTIYDIVEDYIAK